MLNLNSLNPEQRLAVETIRGPVLILAGAGTGKTRVITFRIAHLIECGISPGKILAVTFTNKAAREMRERIAELVPTKRRRSKENEDKAERPTICTFHSLCVRILRRHIEKLGYKRNFVIYDEAEQLTVARKILSQIATPNVKVDPNAIVPILSRYKNGGLKSVENFDENLVALTRHIQPRYEAALRACNAVDFDDLILLTLRLFREQPDALEQCRDQFQFVMVDEYQDTNAAQFELVHAITKTHRNFCVVGDDDQSIYGWRGAEIANLLNLEQHYPEVKVVKLEQNYRSTNVILKAANAVIKNNPRRRGKQLWSAKGEGEKITLHTFADEQEEARVIVEEIEYRRQIRRIPWEHQAILFRTNIQSRPLETALRKAGVRYHLIGGQSFFDRREIRDFVAYLKVLVQPDDDISLLRIANVPARGLSNATMERLLAASQERKCSVYAAMKNPVVTASFPAAARRSIEGFLQLIDGARNRLLETGPLSLRTWGQTLLDDIRYFDELRRSEKDKEIAENRIRNLQEMAAAMDHDALEGTTPLERLQSYLSDLALDQDRATDKEPEGDAVTLITTHSCKGLEFPHVYVVGVEEGILPHSRSKEEGTLDEERRLFYVAITRAMVSLSLSYCLGRMKYGSAVQCHPSRFLNELPPELVEAADEKGKAAVTVDTGKNFFDSLRSAIG